MSANMSSMEVFKHENFGSIRVINQDGNIYFVGKDVADVLGYSNSRKALGDHVKAIHKKMETISTVSGNQSVLIIDEAGLYALIFASKLPEAERFQDWVYSEVLPSIRKHGAYLTQQLIDRTLQDPDYLIQLATQIKQERALRAEAEQKRLEEEQKRLEAEATAEVISEENDLQKEMIEGMSEEVPVAELRQRIVRIMQQRGGGVNIQGAYHALYKEFELKYHMQLTRRMRRDGFTGSQLDYIDKKLNMIPELFDLVCKLFGEEKERLVKSWSKYVGRPSAYRNLTERKQKIQDVINRKKSEDGEELVEA